MIMLQQCKIDVFCGQQCKIDVYSSAKSMSFADSLNLPLGVRIRDTVFSSLFR